MDLIILYSALDRLTDIYIHTIVLLDNSSIYSIIYSSI